jgi:hypothetical protein
MSNSRDYIPTRCSLPDSVVPSLEGQTEPQMEGSADD